MPAPPQGQVKTHGPSLPQRDEEYYYDDDEDDYDDVEDDDDELDEDDDDVVLAGNEDNKENKPQPVAAKRTTKGNLRQNSREDYEDDRSTNASEDKRSVGSHQQVLQQQQQQQQQAKPAKSGGLCSGRSSTQVRETQKPVEAGARTHDQKGSETASTDGAKAENGTKPATAKKSGGLCRSSKNVEVEDSLKPANLPPKDSKETGKPIQEDTKKTAGGVQNGAKNEPGAKKSGGMCGGDKSVQVEESLSPTESPGDTAGKGSTNQKLGKDIQGSQPSANQSSAAEKNTQQSKDGKSSEKLSPKKSGGLWGGRSGVEVKDSLSPAENPDVEESTKQTKASPVKGNQRFREVEEEEEEEEMAAVVKTKTTKKKKKGKGKKKVEEEEFKDEFADDEDMLTEIYVGPEPPPPTLKKGKKKKKGDGSYVKDEPLSLGNKKGKYAVTMAEDETPTKKKSKTKSYSGETYDLPQDDEERGQPSQKRKKKKKVPLETDPELDVRSVYENQLAEVEALPLHEDTIEFTTDSLQPTFEDENELLENAKQERHKNKQRLREKKMREKEFDSPVKESEGVSRAYSSAQREIERVLQPGDSTDKEDGKKKHKDKKKKDKEGKENKAYEENEPEVKETLSQARDRMHQLLDDAFTLISQSHSSVGSKSEKSKKDSDDSEDEKKKKSKKSKKSRPDSPPSHDEEQAAAPEEKKHTPLYVQRTHGPYDSSGLVTWSPYSAADEVNTIISLPQGQRQQPPYVPRQEKTSTSVFSEQLPPNIKPYYTSEPAEPIVINTRNMDTNAPPPYENMDSFKPSNTAEGTYAQGLGASRGTFQNPIYSNALPYTTMDRYSEPYHPMTSFQEIPQRDTDPVIAGDRRLAASEPYPGANSRSRAPSGRGDDSNVIVVQEHRPPQSRERPNQDVADVIYDSMRPGTSPQPLIDSLREELQGLSHRRATEGTGRHGTTLLDAASGANGRTNGTTKRHNLLGSRGGTPPDL